MEHNGEKLVALVTNAKNGKNVAYSQKIVLTW